MDRIIKFEFSKLFHSASFYVCGGCVMLLALLGELLLMFTETFFGYSFKELGTLGLYSGTICLTNGASMGNLPMILGILVAISIGSEYSNKTFKNVWSRGFSRFQSYVAKLIVMSVAALIYALLMMIVCFLLGTALCGIGKPLEVTQLIALIIQLFLVVALAVAFCLIAFMFKKTSISVVIAVMIPSLLSMGASAIDLAFKFKEIDFEISPFILTNQIALIAIDQDTVTISKAFICGVVYLVFCSISGYFVMRKDEI